MSTKKEDKYTQQISAFITMLEESVKIADRNANMLAEYNKKQQDLLHDLEIPETMYVKDITAIGKELRQLRKERRVCKDELIVAEVVKKFIDENPQVLQKLKTLLTSVSEKEGYINNKRYVVKSTLKYHSNGYIPSSDDMDETIVDIITKILKKWSPVYETKIIDSAKVCNIGTENSIINFSLTNLGYDYSAARSSFSNFKVLLMKDIATIFGDSVSIDDFTISDMHIVDIETNNYKLPAKFNIMVNGKLKYSCEGCIIYAVKNKPKNKKKRK